MALVLYSGFDLALLETRKMILEQAGHTVITAENQSAVAAACKQYVFDVAVIGQSISAKSKKSTASIIREQCPSARILELHASHQSRAVDFADSWLEVPADVPQDLADRVTQLTMKAKKPLNHCFKGKR